MTDLNIKLTRYSQGYYVHVNGTVRPAFSLKDAYKIIKEAMIKYEESCKEFPGDH